MVNERKSIVAYIRQRAEKHRASAVDPKKPQHASYHRGLAVIFDALAGDVQAEFDRA